MNRITKIEIAGKEYPLNFSKKAMKEMSAKYGGIEKIGDAFSGDAVKALDEVVWMLHLLIEQGVAYRRIVDGVTVESISLDDLEVVLGVSDIASLKIALMNAIAGGTERTVEVEPDPKNGETTQGN